MAQTQLDETLRSGDQSEQTLPMMVLSFLSCQVRIWAEPGMEGDIARLLRAFVPDAGNTPEEATAVTKVVISRSSTKLAMLRQLFDGAVTKTVLRPFKEHTGTEYLQAVELGSDQVLFAQHWRDLALVLSAGTVRIVISDERPCPSDVVLYVIREAVLRAGYRRGEVLLHGASLWSPATGGVLLLGEKGSGKTTSLISMLEGECDVQLISNDRSYVTTEPMPEVFGYPQSVRIGAGTVYAFPRLHRALLHSYRRRNAEKFALLSNRAPTHRKFSLSPAELAKVFRRRHVARAPLRVIIALRSSPMERWRRLSPPEREEELFGARFLEPDDLYPDEWIRSNVVALESHDSRLWKHMPMFSLELPIDAPPERRRELIRLISHAALDTQ